MVFRLCGLGGNFNMVLGGFIWFLYAFMMLQHFYDTAVRVPRTQRVMVENRELRLPRLYFCPADRGHVTGFQWHSFECTLSYRDEHRSCPARLQAYNGRTPKAFGRTPDGDGFADQHGGECLEFATHMIGVREEWSAAWNQVTLRAAFSPAPVEGLGDALQEVELGYLPVEWEVGEKDETAQRYYYPLLRVPFFFLSQNGYEPGVATRSFLAREVDKGLTAEGKYWYTYGAMQIAVVNASTPDQSLVGTSSMLPQRQGVVHVVLTVDDFEEYDFQELSCFFPLLEALGSIAGVGAVLVLVLNRPRIRMGGQPQGEESLESCSSPSGGPQYARVGPEDDSDQEEEALLGSKGKRAARSHAEDRGQSSLLSTEVGMDGL
mmetsp:Transcript_26206/g.66913  ORF Transcript_26206/g.66913 Transcript_26206/m.66913 type:complete len:377 (+) Transcript_26206:169-1299(+)